MMSYRYDKHRQKKQRSYVLASLCMIVIFFTPFLSWVFDLLERPLERAWIRSEKNIDNLSNIAQRFYGKGALIRENQDLKRNIKLLEVDALRTEYLQSLIESYQDLKINSSEEESIVVAQVISRAPYSPQDTIVINQGRSDGLSEGNIVIAYDNVFLGRVAEVFDTSSRVSLLTKNNIQTQAVLFPHSESLLVVGYGGSYFAELPRESKVELGDVVYSQEDSGRIIAVVRAIEFDPRDPFKQVYLSGPVNIKDVQVVAVVK